MSKKTRKNIEEKQLILNLYISGMSEEFIAMYLDKDIRLVISILKELDTYKGSCDEVSFEA